MPRITRLERGLFIQSPIRPTPPPRRTFWERLRQWRPWRSKSS
jgi:hypothetical protein